jgi:hypothetical protein
VASLLIPPRRSYFSHSSTLRSIYVLRYFLFAGGTAVAGALLELWTRKVERPVLGLLVGLAMGLVVFWGQLRNAFAPRLALSQAALYLVKSRRSARLPWEHVREVVRDGNQVVLRLSVPTSWNGSEPGSEIHLAPRQLGTGAAELFESLQGFALEPSSRQRLPNDADLQARIEKK